MRDMAPPGSATQPYFAPDSIRAPKSPYKSLALSSIYQPITAPIAATSSPPPPSSSSYQNFASATAPPSTYNAAEFVAGTEYAVAEFANNNAPPPMHYGSTTMAIGTGAIKYEPMPN